MCETYVLVNPGESIQDAIDSICSEGGVVELAAGTHILSQGGTIDITLHKNQYTPETPTQVGPKHWIGDVTFPYGILLNERNNITIQGAGRNETILDNYGASYYYSVILINKGSNITIKDLFIQSNSTTAGTGVNVMGINPDTIISNVRVETLGKAITTNSDQIFLLNEYHAVDNLSIEDCLVSQFRYSAISWRTTYNSIIKDCEIINAGAWGIDLNQNCDYNIIEKNVVRHSTAGGIKTYTGNYGNIIRDNVCYENREGIHVRFGATNIDVINNTCRNNTQYGIVVKSTTIECDDVNIKNNRVYDNDGHGIGVVWEYNHPNAGAYDVTIESNTIYSNGGDGIRQDIELYDIVVKNNIITDNDGYGINHLNDESQFIISYNDVRGNAAGDYHGVSAGTGDISADPLFADPANADFHLKSSGGRWTPEGWVIDDVKSPCIDAGDPSDDYSNEPTPNGGRINMGAYGNTMQASKSWFEECPQPKSLFTHNAQPCV